MKQEKKYICIRDLQKGDFGVGIVATIKEWKEIAIDWSGDYHENWVDWLKKKYCSKSLLDWISETWQIEIVEFDENNKEHIEIVNYRKGKSL